METAEIKKTAERVMQGLVNEFAGRASPNKYRHSHKLYEAMVRDLHRDYEIQIRGASLLMIHLGMAEAGEYQPYIDQLDAIRNLYLHELTYNPEQPA
jgi:hypothetical protein